jgi:hypothetical protein
VTPSQTWDATGDPYALNVELHIPVAAEHLPKAGAFCRVWGIDLQTLLNARSFNSQPIQVFGGMQAGLPLANPAQQGLLVNGTIMPALGNWVNTDMTLDFYIKGAFGLPTPTHPANVSHNWPKGTPMSQAVRQALTTAYPGYQVRMSISPSLVLPNDEQGIYQTIGQYATYLNGVSKSIITTPNYQGVYVSASDVNKTITVQDGTQAPTQGGQIVFTDLIGQPIWTGPRTVQFKTVMRGDINIGDTITLPPSLATLTEGVNPAGNLSQSNLIQGSFRVTQMLHTGNFRQPDWQSWASTFDAVMAS